MTPEEAITQLAEIVSANHEASEDDIYRALADAGMPDELADKGFKFTQIAWGRVFLSGRGIAFSDDYLWLDASGSLVESGQLSKEPFYIAASQLAEKYVLTPAFARLALTSADVYAVNDALTAGASLENLVTGPTCLFAAEPTEEGMERARETLEQFLNK